MRFQNRREAGKALARELRAYADRPDVVVLALPRGGVPVGYEIAAALHAPLDVFVVRKLGTPGNEELAMGAIASGGVRAMNDDVVQYLGISSEAIDAVAAREQMELERRERNYRGERPLLDVRGRIVILVDDGLATGATMRAAVLALLAHGPARIVVASPVCTPSTCEIIESLGDTVSCTCAQESDSLFAIGLWYDDFTQLTDAEVRSYLDGAPPMPAIPPKPAYAIF